MSSSLGAESFSATAPTLWNNLPLDLSIIKSPVNTLKKKLYTYLLKHAFSDFRRFFEI